MDEYDANPTNFEKPTPLQYDVAIYWLLPYAYVECGISMNMVHDPRAMTMLEEELQHALQREVPWSHYVTRDTSTDDNLAYQRVYRRCAYEQPGYTRIEVWRMSDQTTQFRLAPQGGNTVLLDLRPLSYHGEQVRGVLHDGVLYVVLR